jgi:hypothetical protein
MVAIMQVRAGHSVPKPPVQPPGALAVSVDIDGCRYTGSYTVVGDIVTAYWGLKQCTRTTRGAPTSSVARKLLRELVRPLSVVGGP